MQEIAQLLVMLIAYYLTLGIMGVGFATMFAGEQGARAAARFFFLTPVQRLVGQARVGSVALLAGVWRILVKYTFRPFIEELTYWLRWLTTRERGWLQRKRRR